MIENHEFEAAAPAVMHCEALRGRSLTEPPRQGVVETLAQRLVPSLCEAIGTMGVAGDIEGRCGEAAARTLDEHLQQFGEAAAHFLFGFGRSKNAIIASFPALALMHRLELMLGGTGASVQLADVPPLPRSVELAARTLAARVETQLRQIFGDGISAAPPRLEHDLRKIDSLRNETLQAAELEFACPEGPPVILALAIRQTDVPRLAKRLPTASEATPAPEDIGDPFLEIPLATRATLAEMRISSRRLADLKPDDVLPIAVARSVPLSIAGKRIALGTVGELDDCAALKITQNLL